MRVSYFNKYRNINSKGDMDLKDISTLIASDKELSTTITNLRALANGKESKLSTHKLESGLKNLGAYTPSCLLYIK